MDYGTSPFLYIILWVRSSLNHHDIDGTIRTGAFGLVELLTTKQCCDYPLVICYIAIENGHRNSGFSHWKWWFSIAMLNYQRVEPGDFSEAIRICVAFCVANGSKCYTIVKEPFPPLDGTSMNPIDFEQPGLFRFLAYFIPGCHEQMRCCLAWEVTSGIIHLSFTWVSFTEEAKGSDEMSIRWLR